MKAMQVNKASQGPVLVIQTPYIKDAESASAAITSLLYRECLGPASCSIPTFLHRGFSIKASDYASKWIISG
jgi:hypothetical protein